jgi:hypothetical protein
MEMPGPPILSQFSRDRMWWTEFGLRREELALRPWREIEEYELIYELIQRERKRQANTPVKGA